MTKNKILHHYNKDHNSDSANEIVPIIIELIQPKSVIDIGCGVAQWLKVFENHGIYDVVGVDGDHVPKEDILIKQEKFIEANLENILQLHDILGTKKFDLVINLEVIEHLNKNIGDEFVQFLTQMGDHILFSAAIPNQTGENHLNEQPHVFWQEIFEKQGYVFLDCFKEKIWNNKKVNWWYAQNMFLVVKKNSPLCKKIKPYNGNLYIHPKLLDLHISEKETLQKEVYLLNNLSSLQLFKKLIRRTFRIK